MTADEHAGKTGRAQARHHDAGPALHIGQRRQFRQLGRIIDDQGLSLDGTREQRGQLPAAPHFTILGAEVGDAALSLPGHHIRMFEADEGLEHLNEAVQHLFQRLGIGQRRHPAQ